MHISEFDYDLPPELIAQQPARPRDASRMMVLDRKTGAWIDSEFRSLPQFLESSDVLVLNDTRVIRARIAGTLLRPNGHTRTIEVLFAGPLNESSWEILCRPGKRVREGDRIVFGEGKLEGIVGKNCDHGLRVLHVDSAVEQLLASDGHVPIPPYIHREDSPTDAVEYQTIFASVSGAIAAPTAGLHFTERMFDQLKDKGVEVVKITLHVGIGTFTPVRTQDPSQHVLKPERCHMTAEAASSLNKARAQGRRIVAVGTTTTRTLEHVMWSHGRFVESTAEADLFILPGYEFKAVNAMLTNFHLPKSTLLMLVSAFASRDKILAAYNHAVAAHYRFYSYGDCMLIQ